MWRLITAPFRSEPVRAPGLLVLLGLVFLGMGVTGAYFQWKAPAVAAEIDALRANSPKDPEERLELWLRFGAPQIHHRVQMLRYSQREPWLVTHIERGAEGEPLTFHGVDVAQLDEHMTTRSGLSVVVHFPAPRELGTAALAGPKAPTIPQVDAGEPFDDRARLTEMVQWAMRNPGDFQGALEDDIPGASLRIVIADPAGGGASRTSER